MKQIFILLGLLLLLSLSVFSQDNKSISASQITPQAATIGIKLIDLPGAEFAKSTWETAYELRIINQDGYYAAIKAGKLKQMDGSEEKLGNLIYKGSFTKKELGKKENRELILTIPFDDEIKERLKKEPKDRVNLSTATPDKETVEKIKEQKKNAQVFLFYANALIYDAKLKKNKIIPLSWIWKFSDYPDADFAMTLEIKKDGGYSRNLVLPADLKNSKIITTKQ